MSRRLWIADEVSGNRAAITGEHARHLTQVLRAQVGQECEVSTGSEIRRARVSSIGRTRVEFELGDSVGSASDSAITIALSIFKFDRMEWAIEKATELGVERIIPVISARTETHLARAVHKRQERWRRIAAEAAEQSRRVSPPEIAETLKFKDFLASAAATRIALAEGEQKLMLEAALAERANPIVLAFGPEGGWEDQELAAFRQFSWTIASLGPMILRAETAVIAAIAIATAALRRE
jgi:16S rRNA (uracil1498-N3)-methyltransferase